MARSVLILAALCAATVQARPQSTGKCAFQITASSGSGAYGCLKVGETGGFSAPSGANVEFAMGRDCQVSVTNGPIEGVSVQSKGPC
ncbi:hypothetical protein CORC01_11158 [Colletotrichum orchidophilum]|uniref:ToxB-like N-terminal ascomycota domain-containing protein n=1 Tax=Colletotrichum orchidophilum TaxID=1209926 RepID=A0A1G4AWQ8_9PEZI|nr:uncharacterized protein CORC01_11158 [Colletotrichum orchidophilum]OHE93561.1 hypothetical protein CORC01_11158 [Colletotrichum orchidophilum]